MNKRSGFEWKDPDLFGINSAYDHIFIKEKFISNYFLNELFYENTEF